jgi:hypothetical protein
MQVLNIKRRIAEMKNEQAIKKPTDPHGGVFLVGQRAGRLSERCPAVRHRGLQYTVQGYRRTHPIRPPPLLDCWPLKPRGKVT